MWNKNQFFYQQFFLINYQIIIYKWCYNEGLYLSIKYIQFLLPKSL